MHVRFDSIVAFSLAVSVRLSNTAVPDSTMRPHPARLDGEVDGELAVQHPTTPPILSALPPLAAMRKEWVEFDLGVLALHLLHQRHEGTVVLVSWVGIFV